MQRISQTRHRCNRAILLTAGVWMLSSAVSAGTPDFVKDVQPILKATCVSCHGADKQKGGLRLDSKKLAMNGGLSGASIVPGDSKKSYLMARVRGEGDETRMPEKAPPLTSEQVATLATWIDAGAEWPDSASVADAMLKKHWAYEKPKRPTPPVPSNAAWVRTPLDAFILFRLDKEGLKPAPEAAKETLLRRLSFDLTGLPPTPQEIEAFTKDTSPDAYEKAVDRLLASPHYGERWATPWLDLARYADTDGFNFDNTRVMWKYRDWVINALNADMPFDRFTVEQIAGDLLPGASLEQKVATGFHRNTMKNNEGGVDPEEARWETLLDRTNTTATVWLGSTLGCSQCHNHKYDPFSQKDYYAFLAFFDNSKEPALKLGEKMQGADGKPKDLTALVLEEIPSQMAATDLRIRGAFVNKGERVNASTPGFLKPIDPTLPRNRLGLAKWLVDKENPLTARVTVNRYWELVFGRGLVETSEDFGTQGSPPTHPALLDWLATEFMEQGWSQKKLLRLIVTSSTYRQSSRLNKELIEKDPYNKLLARAPRHRLDAEMLRDNALSIAGLLSPKIGGPSVFPVAPADIGRLNNNKEDIKWTTSPGEERYRRGLYTFWRRTAPYPTFGNFDAPSREFCTVKRARTNTPLQALSGLNDPAFFEAAQALAKRLQNEGGAGPEQQLVLGFRLCTGRVPSAKQLELLTRALKVEQEQFAKNADAVKKVGGTPELAALTMVANVLLNMDETITRE